ncbi:MAG: hypothetical protein K8R21_04700 [Leptospira sp.]|nr:hypothetical protein [Leptospira sp.]
MIALFLLEIVGKKKIRKYVSSKTLIASLFLSVISVIVFSYSLQPAFTLVIPIGILFFYGFLLIFTIVTGKFGKKV